MGEQQGELAALARAFAAHLRAARRRGARGVSAARSPRVGPAEDRSAAQSADDLDAHVEPPADQPSAAPEQALAVLREHLGDCERCDLAAHRTKIVFGAGAAEADLMFIGEAPGRDEDLQGEPFVGAAGQLLTKMIKAMGLTREEVYIANIIKCRPPRNRDPEPDEVATCEPFLVRQIDAIAPRMIIAMGRFAAKTLLQTERGITRVRGNWGTYRGIPVMPTFHPAYLLRNAGQKRAVWNDLQAVMAEMDRLGLARRR